MNRLPQWARKPQHSKKVIATSRGWEVAQTGEVLTSVRGLKEKLDELFQETDKLRVELDQPQKDEDVKTPEDKVDEPVKTEEKADDPKPEEPPKPRKRRGRPPKKKTEDTE